MNMTIEQINHRLDMAEWSIEFLKNEIDKLKKGK
jgi:hypothetical protein